MLKRYLMRKLCRTHNSRAAGAKQVARFLQATASVSQDVIPSVALSEVEAVDVAAIFEESINAANTMLE